MSLVSGKPGPRNSAPDAKIVVGLGTHTGCQDSSAVEQRTHKPLVGGSNPSPGTNLASRSVQLSHLHCARPQGATAHPRWPNAFMGSAARLEAAQAFAQIDGVAG
jgi:hypothetical protein